LIRIDFQVTPSKLKVKEPNQRALGFIIIPGIVSLLSVVFNR